MVEVLDNLERIVKERADSIRKTSEALAGDAEGLLLVAKDSCNLVGFLQLIWRIMQERLRKGGTPAKRLRQECDLIISLSEEERQRFTLLEKKLSQGHLTSELAQPIYDEVQAAIGLLESLVHDASNARERAAAIPHVSADPEELKRRIKQADENQEWAKFADVFARGRQGSSHGQE